jgi:hypothetical protein
MEPVSLITTALAAGAKAAIGDEVRASVKVAYTRLRTLAIERLGGDPAGEYIVGRHERAPDTWQTPLAAELTEAGAGQDTDLVDAAQKLMALLDTRGFRSGRYVINVSGAQGVQIGDNNTQTNNFSR